MNRDQKEQLLTRLENIAADKKTMGLLSFKKLSVHESVSLRRGLFEAKASMLVVKNTILKRALSCSESKVLLDSLSGNTALVWGDDPVSLAKAVSKFQKEIKDKVDCPTFFLPDGSGVVEASKLSELPPLEILYGKLLGVLQQVGSQFVRTLSEPAARLARVLSAHVDQ